MELPTPKMDDIATPPKKAVFLDRDGVIIHNRANYIRSWEDVKFYPWAIKALKNLSQTDYLIFVITNQSVIGRGLVDASTIEKINLRILQEIKNGGGRIDQLYICPHAPQDLCTCRKPQPGMIQQAQKEYQLDLSTSWLIGDAYSDLLAGVNSGIKNLIMVSTGRGKKQSALYSTEIHNIHPRIEKNLYNSIKLIINY
jgi:D-glycero-D-manno-heptose 1,7-bisphosphate phosphatase